MFYKTLESTLHLRAVEIGENKTLLDIQVVGEYLAVGVIRVLRKLGRLERANGGWWRGGRGIRPLLAMWA